MERADVVVPDQAPFFSAVGQFEYSQITDVPLKQGRVGQSCEVRPGIGHGEVSRWQPVGRRISEAKFEAKEKYF
jgi:hypothetical protein